MCRVITIGPDTHFGEGPTQRPRPQDECRPRSTRRGKGGRLDGMPSAVTTDRTRASVLERRSGMPLFWRIFALNALVLCAATALLLLAPVTVSVPVVFT